MTYWLLLIYCLITFGLRLNGFWMTFGWLSGDFRMTFGWLSDDCPDEAVTNRSLQSPGPLPDPLPFVLFLPPRPFTLPPIIYPTCLLRNTDAMLLIYQLSNACILRHCHILKWQQLLSNLSHPSIGTPPGVTCIPLFPHSYNILIINLGKINFHDFMITVGQYGLILSGEGAL